MKLVLALLLLSIGLCGQTADRLAPDCILTFTFTATGVSGNYDNRPIISPNAGTPCTEWVLQWSAQPAVTSLTIQIRGAGDSAGTPGAFSSLAAGTTFPSGKVTYTATTGFFPWMQINLAAEGAPGTVTAVLLGSKDNAASISGGGGGGGSGCPGTITTPCVTAGWNGSAAQIFIVATNESDISISAATDIVIVAGTMAQTTYIPKFDISWDNTADASIRTGTGVNCGTGTATLAGPYKNLLALFEDYGGYAPFKSDGTGRDVCLHFSTSVTGGGQVFFDKF